MCHFWIRYAMFNRNCILPVAFSFPQTTKPYPGKSFSSSLTNRKNGLGTTAPRSQIKPIGDVNMMCERWDAENVCNRTQNNNNNNKTQTKLSNIMQTCAKIMPTNVSFVMLRVLLRKQNLIYEKENSNYRPLTLIAQ